MEDSGAAFDYQGTLTKEAVVGTFAREVMASGRIIDCGSGQTISLSVITNKKITIVGSIGVNYGLIDGFFSSMNGTILLENNSLSYVGSAIGANYGTVKNATQTGTTDQICKYHLLLLIMTNVYIYHRYTHKSHPASFHYESLICSTPCFPSISVLPTVFL